MTTIKIILPASDIPDDSIVTYVKGDKKYTICTRLKIYDSEGEDREIVRTGGCRFLICNRGRISVVTPTECLVWVTTHEELYEFLKAAIGYHDNDE